MRRFLTALIALIALAPCAALAKPWHGHGRQQATAGIEWLSVPDGIGSGGHWDARFRVDLGDPADLADLEPVVVVRDAIHGVTHHYAAAPAGAEGEYHARIPFAEAGSYTIEGAGWNPYDHEAVAPLGPQVVIEPRTTAPAGTGGGGTPWSLVAVAGAALACVAGMAARRSRRLRLNARPA